MANSFKIVYSAVVNCSVQGLHNQVSTAAQGWQSTVQDNATAAGGFQDALVMPTISFNATAAPANSKAAFIYAYAGVSADNLTNPATGTEGTLNVVDFTSNALAMRLIGTIPYTTQGETVEGGPFSVAQGFGGILPPYWGIFILNHSGAQVSAAGSSVKYVYVHVTAA
ncbi:MAG: hypothetical protein C4523_02510 [Myxococcales bacterium]|nr:MAG: hypothetical protein C4523_02510 [Myxococcales bacterium]